MAGPKAYGVILAGGLASRMGGGDKGRLLLGGRPILDHVLARFAPQVRALALNANGKAARFDDLGLPVLPDDLPDHPGPLAGVLAGMEWAARKGATHVISVAADTPFLPRDLAAKLSAAGDFAIAASQDDSGRLWPQPTFGLWPVALRADLRQALNGGLRRIRDWADPHGAAYVAFDTTEGVDPFFNINTPDELLAAEALARDLPL